MSLLPIYVVDDDDALRRSVELLIEANGGFTTLSFPSGDDFLAEVAELGPGCVLLDINMPGTNGLDVLRQLNRTKGHFEVLVLTGRGDIGLAVEAMKAGAGDFIEKPYDNRSLIGAVDAAFDRLDSRVKQAGAVKTAQERIDRLTPRERDVLLGLIDGKANKIIAYELDISPRTVEIYRANLMDKLEVRSVAESVRIAFTAGLIQLTPEP